MAGPISSNPCSGGGKLFPGGEDPFPGGNPKNRMGTTFADAANPFPQAGETVAAAANSKIRTGFTGDRGQETALFIPADTPNGQFDTSALRDTMMRVRKGAK